ncbi:MAG: hypothetical protein HY246_20070 [Proteobacteria bacterium]|nr:hypothetical protein [Pseudomonadota bacterium]
MAAPDPTEGDSYRAEVWKAVGALWRGFGDKPDELVTSLVPAAPAYIDIMYGDGAPPQAAAIELVVFVVRIYIESSLTQAQRQERLVELHKLQRMSFEEAQGYRALPFVASLVAAWQIAVGWAKDGKVDPGACKLLLSELALALADKPSQHWSALAQLTLDRAGKS